jgi:hypothetical protein
VLEIGERQRFRSGDGAEGDRHRGVRLTVSRAAAELNHQAHAVFSLGREQHPDKS